MDYVAFLGIIFGLWSSGQFWIFFLEFSDADVVVLDFGRSDIGSAYRSPRTLLAIPQDLDLESDPDVVVSGFFGFVDFWPFFGIFYGT